MWFKPKTSIGVDIGAGGIKLVELKQEKNRPVLFTYGLTSEKQGVHKLHSSQEKNIPELLKKTDSSEAAPKQEEQIGEDKIEKYANMLKAVCKAAKITTKSAIVSLPVSSVFHTLVTLPLMKKEEVEPIVRAEVKKLLPIPLEQAALDYQVLTGKAGAKTQRILVNAVPHQLITFYSKIFQRAGLVLDALEPESAALTRCLVGKDQAITMIIDIGAERTSFFIIDQGVPITHQSIESGGNKIDKLLQNVLGIENNLVEQVKYDIFEYMRSVASAISEQKFLELFIYVIDPIIKEIEVSFELFFRQSGNENKRPEKIILTGGMSLMPYLTKYIADKFKIKCFVGDPWARVVYQEGLRPILRQMGPRMSVAIGLALRNMT